MVLGFFVLDLDFSAKDARDAKVGAYPSENSSEPFFVRAGWGIGENATGFRCRSMDVNAGESKDYEVYSQETVAPLPTLDTRRCRRR